MTTTDERASERPLDLIRRRLSLTPAGDDPHQWSAKCPAHDDHRESLSVHEIPETRNVLLNCRAGCETDAVLAMLGLEPEDLLAAMEWKLASIAHRRRQAQLATNDDAAILSDQDPDGLPLLAAHRIRLMDHYGLSAETIREAGLRTCTDREEAAKLLNRKFYPRSNGAAIVIPYRDAGGATVLCRLRPDSPPVKKTGKAQKYLQPSRTPPRLYVPPRTFPALADVEKPLIVTEGEFKSLAAMQHGFCCVALPGVDCWHPKGKLSTLSPDLAEVAWQNRSVFVAFDSDAATNENVQRAERELAAALGAHGAKVKIVRIPMGEPDAEGTPTKTGVDDFLKAKGREEFQQLLDAAEEPKPPQPGEFLDAASEMDPAIEAEHFLATLKIAGVLKLRFWMETWYQWSDGRYGEARSAEVRAAVVNHLNKRYLGVHARHVSDLLEHLRAKAILPGNVEPPSWLESPPGNWPAAECLPTRNAVVHLPSLVESKQPCEVAASPAFFATTATEFPLDLNASRPDAWLAFLRAQWNNDPQSIEALQEWFGYLLTPDTRHQKLLMLVGPKRSGKGTIARVLTSLVGKENVTGPTLSGLATNFGLWPLLGKSVAIISDARLSGRADQAAVVERILSITGEDAITIDRKNLTPLTLQLPTRFVILTNELPKFTDASGAIVSRCVLLHTTRSFYGQEDHGLTEKLLAELPGILLWAIEGWRRLRERGRFMQPESGRESLGEMDDIASPVSAFMRERCEVKAGATVVVKDLFEAYKQWCKEQGRDHVGTAQSFGRDLKAVEPRIRTAQPRNGSERLRVYVGIRLAGES
jgi:putative DNA primase/helicase